MPKRSGSADYGAPGKRVKRQTAAYDPGQPIDVLLERFTAPRKKNNDRARSKPATALRPRLAAVVSSRPALWLTCGDPPKRARLIGGHDALVHNIEVICGCPWCLELDGEDADASEDDTAAARSQQAGPSNARQPGAGPSRQAAPPRFRGRVFNLPQWYEHCTGWRVVGLDPDKHPAEFRDLLLSVVYVAGAEGEEARGRSSDGGAGEGAAGTSARKSLRRYLRSLARSEPRTGQRVHVYYNDQPPDGRWFSGTVLQADNSTAVLTVLWDAWTDETGQVSEACEGEVLQGVTLLHFGPQPPPETGAVDPTAAVAAAGQPAAAAGQPAVVAATAGQSVGAAALAAAPDNVAEPEVNGQQEVAGGPSDGGAGADPAAGAAG
ncbi:hypothetical protein Agub_g10261, partial [Astrephomene gubernaculifera]